MPEWREEIERRLADLHLDPAREAAVVEELSQHLDDRYEEMLAGGATAAEAYRRTLSELSESGVLAGGLRRVERESPPELIVAVTDRRTRIMADLWQDLRHGARMLWKNPGFTAVAVLTLALGIGANTAIFSVVNALLLRPLPYKDPERLVKVFRAQPDPAKGMLPSLWSYPRFVALQAHNQSFAGVAGYTQSPYALTGTDTPERVQVEVVSASYFPLLGVSAAAGRTFEPEEGAAPGAAREAILGYGLWQRRFGGDLQAIGGTIELDKQTFTVVGVMPPDFRGQSGTADVWLPMTTATAFVPRILADANEYWFQVVCRLQDGVTPEQARADLGLVGERIERQYPALKDAAAVPALQPLQAAKVDPAIQNSFLILLAAVGLVLLIACGNVANLLLARAVSRRREFAVRSALGASRRRLARQVLTESALLALLGGLLGVIVAYAGLELLKEIRPSDNTQFWRLYTRTFDYFSLSPDWRVLGFNFALALLTGLLFGLFPALQSAFGDVNEALKAEASGVGAGLRGRRKMSARGMLVAGEIALSLVLLIGAGLLVKSLARLQAVELGFAPEGVLTMAAASRDARPQFYEELLARVQAIPGVESAGVGSTAPLLGHGARAVMDVESRPDVKRAGICLYSVSPDYFRTLGISLQTGRLFTDRDRAGASRVAVINAALAEKFFPGEEPLGKRLRPYVDTNYETAETFVEVVGVVGDARYGRLEEAIEPALYLCSLQPTDPTPILVVRTGLDPASVTAAVRREVSRLDLNVPLTSVQTMAERAGEMASRPRFIAVLLGLFAGLALLLAAVGTYGVMAYSVSARTRELGIRMALGARASDVLRLVLREGAALIAVGLAAGLAAAWASLRVLQGQLYDLDAADPTTFGLVTVLLAAVALLACYLPARRAASIEPLTALRRE